MTVLVHRDVDDSRSTRFVENARVELDARDDVRGGHTILSAWDGERLVFRAKLKDKIPKGSYAKVRVTIESPDGACYHSLRMYRDGQFWLAKCFHRGICVVWPPLLPGDLGGPPPVGGSREVAELGVSGA